MVNSKSLIAYFSREGNNYVAGSIVKLRTGNTEVIAKKIQALTGSDLFKIKETKDPESRSSVALSLTRVKPRSWILRPRRDIRVEESGNHPKGNLDDHCRPEDH